MVSKASPSKDVTKAKFTTINCRITWPVYTQINSILIIANGKKIHILLPFPTRRPNKWNIRLLQNKSNPLLRQSLVLVTPYQNIKKWWYKEACMRKYSDPPYGFVLRFSWGNWEVLWPAITASFFALNKKGRCEVLWPAITASFFVHIKKRCMRGEVLWPAITASFFALSHIVEGYSDPSCLFRLDFVLLPHVSWEIIFYSRSLMTKMLTWIFKAETEMVRSEFFKSWISFWFFHNFELWWRFSESQASWLQFHGIVRADPMILSYKRAHSMLILCLRCAWALLVKLWRALTTFYSLNFFVWRIPINFKPCLPFCLPSRWERKDECRTGIEKIYRNRHFNEAILR